MKTTWKVIEDNGGGLHLYVLRGERCVWAGTHYEGRGPSLHDDLTALVCGSDASDWDGGDEDPQASYDYWTEEMRRNGGWQLVADEDGQYPEDMGAAAREAFGYDKE